MCDKIAVYSKNKWEVLGMKRIVSLFAALVLVLSVGLCTAAQAAEVTYSLTTEEQDIFLGKTYKRKIKTVPAGADTSSALWLSSDESVASVDPDGTVRARSQGNATIMVEIEGYTFSYKVRVVAPFLSCRTKSLYLGRQYTLEVNGGSGKITWKTSNKKVASVNKNGLITARKPGKATVTATRNGVSMQCKVTVLKPAFKKTSVNLQVGGKTRLRINGGTEKAKWKSSNPAVVTVNSNGTLRGKKIGKATVTATLNGYKLSCKVNVYTHMLSRSSLTLEAGDSQKLTVTGGSGKVTWKSSNPKIATVNSKGVVTGKGAGTATITAIKNGFKLNCKVTVRVTSLSAPTGKDNIVEAYCEAVNKAKAAKNFKLTVSNDPTFRITRATDTKNKIIFTIMLEMFFKDAENSYTFKNGLTEKGNKPTAFIPPLFQSCSLDSAGVASASAKKDGNGYIIKMKLNKEKAHFSGTGSNTSVYNKAVSKPLNLSVYQIADDDDLAKITITYTGTEVTAKVDNRGRLTNLTVTAPQTFRVDTNFSADITTRDYYVFKY